MKKGRKVGREKGRKGRREGGREKRRGQKADVSVLYRPEALRSLSPL